MRTYRKAQEGNIGKDPEKNEKGLREELGRVKLENELLEEIIGLSEKQTGLSLRKKFGPQAVINIRQRRGCSITVLCLLLGYSRQNFYQTLKRAQKDELEKELIVQQVIKIRETQEKVGTRKLLVHLRPFLKEHRVSIGRDCLDNARVGHVKWDCIFAPSPLSKRIACPPVEGHPEQVPLQAGRSEACPCPNQQPSSSRPE